jgi:uncharacterized protein (TIGR00645 family)
VKGNADASLAGPVFAFRFGEGIVARAYRFVENAIFFARWLTAPFIVVLVGGILLLIYKSFVELYEVFIHLPTTPGKQVLVGVLNLVDFALAANVILIVIFSGYENFIRRVDTRDNPDWPEGISERDFGGLKLKLLGSIAAIAAVEGLEWFLDIEKYSDPSKFVWAIGFQLTIFVSVLLLAGAEHLAVRREKT